MKSVVVAVLICCGIGGFGSIITNSKIRPKERLRQALYCLAVCCGSALFFYVML